MERREIHSGSSRLRAGNYDERANRIARLAQMITERESPSRELQRILDEKTNPWGITVQSVEIRDVRIAQAL